MFELLVIMCYPYTISCQWPIWIYVVAREGGHETFLENRYEIPWLGEGGGVFHCQVICEDALQEFLL